MGDSSNSISVCVRVRPFTVREAAQINHAPDGPLFLGDGSLAAAPAPKLSSKGLRSVIKVVDEKCLVFDPPEDNPYQKFSRSFLPQGKRVKDQTFCFDKVFDDNTNQADVYEATTRQLLDSVLDGYNATVFAYGATGCGKTHTITGTLQQPGIIFLTMQELFERISETSEEKVTEVSLSYLEIYNETIRDLLLPVGEGGAVVPKQGLNLREDSNQVVSVTGLSQHRPENVQEVMDMVVRGNEARTMSPTAANATSSRSHAVLQINVSRRDRNAGTEENYNMATLSIIDLAGSERASATKNRGERLIEGANINKSLLALGSCINALCDPRRRSHVPYRDSKLTRLLKFSLGGNCKTVMIVCVSPSSAHFDETQNTLRYANRAKNIQTKVTKNVYNVNRHVKDYLVKIDEQIKLINELRAQQKDHETLAFNKFRKQTEKRDGIVREGVERIRIAYSNCSAERGERTGMMKRLKQVERRIGLISSWSNAFEAVVCDERQCKGQKALENLSAIHKTAQDMLLELENSRHHFHQRLAKTNWARSIDTALQTGLRQIHESDGLDDGSEASNLRREAELMKSIGEREALAAVAEQEKAADMQTVSVLLKAQFETVAAIQGLMDMDEESAMRSARKILGEIVNSTTTVASHIIKPDASVTPIDFLPPPRTSPRRKKSSMSPAKLHRLSLLAPAPPTSQSLPQLQQHYQASSSSQQASPLRSSPRRLVVGAGAAKKGVQFTPQKKSPRKASKKSLRWRDETGEGSMLVDYSRTPQKFDSSPNLGSPTPQRASAALPDLHPKALALSYTNAIDGEGDDVDSSPLQAPTLSFDPDGSATKSPTPPLFKPGSARFKSGFLAKKSSTIPSSESDFSNPDSRLAPPSLSSSGLASSEEDGNKSTLLQSSPLRDLSPSQAGNRTSLGGSGSKRLSGSRIPRSPPHISTLANNLNNNNNDTTISAADSSILSTDSSGSSSDRENQHPQGRPSAAAGRTRAHTTSKVSTVEDATSLLGSDEVRRVKNALKQKRASSVHPGSSGLPSGGSGGGTSGNGLSSSIRSHRRRSPPGASTSISPSYSATDGGAVTNAPQSLFSASHARRMVRRSNGDLLGGGAGGPGGGRESSVLSPRTRDVAVTKSRRGTLGSVGSGRDGSGESRMSGGIRKSSGGTKAWR